MIRIFGLFFALSSVSAFANIEIDLRGRGGPMEGIGQTAQGYHPTDLCGFFTFSNYLDSHRISRGFERGAEMTRSNPVSIGVEYAIRKNLPYWFPLQNTTDPLSVRMGRAGSLFCTLAEAVRESGYCADESLPSQTVDETAKFSDLTTYFYAELQEIAEALPARRIEFLNIKIGGLYAAYFNWASERKNILFDQNEIRELIAKQIDKPYLTIRSLFLSKCNDQTRRKSDFDFGSCRSEFFVKNERTRADRAARKISELLEAPRAMPVPIAYCGVVLKEGKAYGTRKRPVGADCGLHWSLVVGRRQIGEDRYLLVHNSWRPNANYSKDWILDEGDIWVREKELTRATVLVQWLEE